MNLFTNKIFLILTLSMGLIACKTQKSIHKFEYNSYSQIVVKNDVDSIGLYYYRKDNNPLFWGGCNIFVALKTPKKFIFPSSKRTVRETQVSSFFEKFGDLFTSEEKNRIRSRFESGNINENGPCVNF